MTETAGAQGSAGADGAESEAEEPAPPPSAVIPKDLLNKNRKPQPDAEAVEQVRQLAMQMAAKEPEAAARVLRGWLNEGKKENAP